MFQKILVPLDDTELSEGILPYASLLSKAMSSEVLLLMVTDTLDVEFLEWFRSRDKESESEPADVSVVGENIRLAEIASRLKEQGIAAVYRSVTYTTW